MIFRGIVHFVFAWNAKIDICANDLDVDRDSHKLCTYI